MQEIRKDVKQYKTLSHPRLLFLKNSPKKPSHAQYNINAIPCPQKPKPYRCFNELLIVTGSSHCERNTRTFRRRHDLLQGGSAEPRAQSHGLFASGNTSHCSSHLSFSHHGILYCLCLLPLLRFPHNSNRMQTTTTRMRSCCAQKQRSVCRDRQSTRERDRERARARPRAQRTGQYEQWRFLDPPRLSLLHPPFHAPPSLFG